MRTSRRVGTAAATALCIGILMAPAVAARSSSDEVTVVLYGIVRLQGTDQALTSQQAALLLPIVRAWRDELSNSWGWGASSSASCYVGAIQPILTQEQLDRIAAMRLTADAAIRWSGGSLYYRSWFIRPQPGDMPPGAPPPGDGSEPPAPPGGGTPPPGRPRASVFFFPTQEDPRVAFADKVIRLLAAWTADS